MLMQRPPSPQQTRLPSFSAGCRAIAKLYKKGGEAPKYPVAFLTNGGGVSEERKAEQLSEWLGVHVKASQVGIGRCCRALGGWLGIQPWAEVCCLERSRALLAGDAIAK